VCHLVLLLLRLLALELLLADVELQDVRSGGAPATRFWVYLASLPVVLALGAGVGLLTRLGGRDNPDPATALAANVFLPTSYVPLDKEIVQDRNGKSYYRSIARAMPGVPEPVEFIVIVQEMGSDPETFYIMQNKVFVDLFKAFAETKGVRWSNWNSTAPPQYPALGVAVDDAWKFAYEFLDGKLPTTDQWDRAAGFSVDKSRLVGREGPCRGTWRQASPLKIALTEARPVGESEDDVSPSGCRDMAGNGFEWTRSLFGTKQTLPLADSMQTVNVLLRGKGFSKVDDIQPLTYRDLQHGMVAIGSTSKELMKDYGFRVVLESKP
jgi:hypothetical protein